MKSSFFLLVPASLLFSGCDDDSVPDIRDQAVGSYDYKIRFYSPSGSALNYYGQQFDEFSTLKVEKDPGDENSIVIDDAPTCSFLETNLMRGVMGSHLKSPTQLKRVPAVTLTSLKGIRGLT